jgi:hypothetical protein
MYRVFVRVYYQSPEIWVMDVETEDPQRGIPYGIYAYMNNFGFNWDIVSYNDVMYDDFIYDTINLN